MATRTLRPVYERFISKVMFTESCWIWTGPPANGGYGTFWLERKRPVGAHRMSYMLHKGGIPDGLTIDHLCNVPACVNPAHLQLLPLRENILRGPFNPSALNIRKTVCKRGHELSGDNVYINGKGERVCRSCAAIWSKEAYARLKARRVSV